MNASPTPLRAPRIKARARRRPSHGRRRTGTLLRGALELAWCTGVLAAATHLSGLPDAERSRTIDPLLQGTLPVVVAGLLVASAAVAGPVGAYRLIAGALDVIRPRQRLDGVVADRGTVEGGPWTPASLSPLVGWRSPTTLRWVTVGDAATGRRRTLLVSDRDRWFAAAPGATVRVVATSVLQHVRSVEVLTPAPPLVPDAPFAAPRCPSIPSPARP